MVDLGSSTVKAGYAGEDTPKAVFPSTVGWLEKDGGDVEMKEAKDDKRSKKKGADKEEDKDDKKAETKEYFVGDASFRRDHVEMTGPFDDEGLIEDWDVVEAIWEHTLRKRLVVHPDEHPVLSASPRTPPASNARRWSSACSRHTAHPRCSSRRTRC